MAGVFFKEQPTLWPGILCLGIALVLTVVIALWGHTSGKPGGVWSLDRNKQYRVLARASSERAEGDGVYDLTFTASELVVLQSADDPRTVFTIITDKCYVEKGDMVVVNEGRLEAVPDYEMDLTA
ncbi:MAG: hypothetical protein PHS53_00165 [Candidatus Pacebacteria bacterium]|nr:hypothetical protein [Candidatus Paceibacterota bacterium]MDD5356550.1 hypothetical protein [Candidatus Paceibacterota bacterium]